IGAERRGPRGRGRRGRRPVTAHPGTDPRPAGADPRPAGAFGSHCDPFHHPHDRRTAPRTCPVCGEALVLTRLGCPGCGTELSGAFEACDFCALSAEDRELLRVFLVSRGNMKELERHLGVSYPTARARYDGLLDRLGLAPPATAGGPDGPDRMQLLERLARGEIDVDQAQRQLSEEGER
ncbi:MAG: DUF2089 domain-containing protein, partial [Acidimicrobiales bacterium]